MLQSEKEEWAEILQKYKYGSLSLEKLVDAIGEIDTISKRGSADQTASLDTKIFLLKGGLVEVYRDPIFSADVSVGDYFCWVHFNHDIISHKFYTLKSPFTNDVNIPHVLWAEVAIIEQAGLYRASFDKRCGYFLKVKS